jgi:uncharacterized membrane protein
MFLRKTIMKQLNLKSKKPSKFKEKLKSFFNVNMDELIKEEESTKVFEKIPLVTLTRNKIFLAIALFLIIVNALVGFDINFLYLRQILCFLFLILVPGLLIMLCFKIRTVKFWEFLVYTIGLSIAFIMFAGLAVNWTLPALNITDKPLSLYPILACFDIFLVTLGIIAWFRNKYFDPVQLTGPKLDALNNIFFIIPMTFPVLAILGAFLLNNHGSNILTMIMLGGIAVYILLLTIFRKKLNENIWPWALWLIGLSMLLSGWMRGWFVSGTDISLEYWVFQLTKENAFWSPFLFNHAYNSMISLNIFPTILSNFILINDQFIFKLFIPILFSIISIIIYLISKKILTTIFCFLAGILFLSLPDFLNWYAIPIRQEIAFIFFSLMVLILLEKQIGSTIKKGLFVIFGISMILSHYSTSYIALAIFLLSYFFIFLYKQDEKKKIKKGKLYPSKKSEFYLKGLLVLLLLLFGFLWYSQVTPIANGLFNFVGRSISHLGNLFSSDNWQGGTDDPILGFFKKPKIIDFIGEYKDNLIKYDLSNTLTGFSKEKYIQYQINYLPSKILNYNTLFFNFSMISYYLKQIISKFFQLFILFGLFYLIKNKNIGNDIKNIFMGASLIVFLFLFIPFFSIEYSLTRFILQILIILSSISLLGGKVLLNKLKYSTIWLSLLLILLFLLFSGFIPQIVGGDAAKMQLNNFGGDYDLHYMTYSDFFGINWLENNKGNFELYADATANQKINSYAGELNIMNINPNLIPNTISKESYVYLSTTNKIEKMGFFVVKNLKISYNFPLDFLNDNKKKVYNNGESELFK